MLGAKRRPKCQKHGTFLSFNPEEGYACPQCERDDWDQRARWVIKDFKCPICCEPVEFVEHDVNYIEFKCKDIFDEKGNYAKPPCSAFRIMVCEECFSYPCQCQDYPEHPGAEI